MCDYHRESPRRRLTHAFQKRERPRPTSKNILGVIHGACAQDKKKKKKSPRLRHFPNTADISPGPCKTSRRGDEPGGQRRRLSAVCALARGREVTGPDLAATASAAPAPATPTRTPRVSRNKGWAVGGTPACGERTRVGKKCLLGDGVGGGLRRHVGLKARGGPHITPLVSPLPPLLRRPKSSLRGDSGLRVSCLL